MKKERYKSTGLQSMPLVARLNALFLRAITPPDADPALWLKDALKVVQDELDGVAALLEQMAFDDPSPTVQTALKGIATMVRARMR